MIALAIAAALQLSYGEFMDRLRDNTESGYQSSKKMIPEYEAIGRLGHVLCMMSTEAKASIVRLEGVKEDGQLFVVDRSAVLPSGYLYTLSEEEKGWVSSEIRSMKLAALEYETYCRR